MYQNLPEISTNLAVLQNPDISLCNGHLGEVISKYKSLHPWQANYRSAVVLASEVEKVLREQAALVHSQVDILTEAEARKKYGNRLQVAALGALGMALHSPALHSPALHSPALHSAARHSPALHPPAAKKGKGSSVWSWCPCARAHRNF